MWGKDNKLFKTKTKSKTKLSVADRTCMFSLQEYQHVHLLCFKKRSFTLVWKPYPPLRSGAPSRSCWRTEWKHNGRALLSLCIRAASALPLLCSTRAVWNQALLKRSHLISEIFLLLQCAAAGSARALEQADHALAQVRPRQIFTRTLSKNGRILVAV